MATVSGLGHVTDKDFTAFASIVIWQGRTSITNLQMDPADDGTGSDVRLAVLFAQQKRLSSRARQDFFTRLVEDDVPNKTVEADLQAPSQPPRRHRPRAVPARPPRLEQGV
eukprot:s274_g12.t1